MSTPQWFIDKDGQRYGPYRLEILRQLIERQKLCREDLVWTEGMSEWARADSVEPLSMLFASEPPPAAAPSAAPDPPVQQPTQQRRRNYFVRHWRGELSLPVSYWVNGSLLTLLLVAILTAIRKTQLFEELGGEGTGLWILAVLMLSVSFAVWQSIGIWRSADEHPSRGGSKGWAIAAKVVVILGFIRLATFTLQEVPLMVEGFRLALGNDRTPPSQLRVVNHQTEVELAGGITFGATDALRKILDATPTIRIVQLNNVGGFITEADRLGQLISARGLSTYTPRQCVSACLLAFMGGKERYLGSKGKLGFHQASVAGVGGEVAKEAQQRYRNVLLERGIPSSFVDRALTAAPSSMWYPTVEELREAHVITSVVNERQFGTTNVREWRNRAALEAAFASVPIFAALRQAEPAAYDNLQQAYVDGIQDGVSQNEIQGKVHQVIVEKVIPKYTRIGPDEQLVGYWRSQIAEMRELRAADPRDCVAFVLGSKDPTLADLNGKLSKRAQEADLASLAALMSAAALHPAAAPNESAVQRPLHLAATRAERTDPGALTLVGNPKKAPDAASLCNAEVAFFDGILALPASDAGPVLRWLAAKGG